MNVRVLMVLSSLALLSGVLSACGGDDEENNFYLCDSCPDAPATEEQCTAWGQAAQCGSTSFELATGEICMVSGSPTPHSRCTLNDCKSVPACFGSTEPP
jgi:hypothetical protein